MNYLEHAQHSYELFRSQLTERLNRVYSQLKDRDLVIWGTGKFGISVFSYLTRYCKFMTNLKCFCDSFHDDNIEKKICGLPVCSPKKATNEFPDAVYVIASDFYEEIIDSIHNSEYRDINIYHFDHYTLVLEKQLSYCKDKFELDGVVTFNHTWFPIFSKLETSGILNEYCENLYPLLEDDESREILSNRISTFTTGDMSFIDKNPINKNSYFSNDYYSIGCSEVLFDCGAFDGDTVKDFVAFTHGKYQKILAFEPDSVNISKLKKLIEDSRIHDVNVVEAATGSSNSEICFCSEGNVSSKVIKKFEGHLQKEDFVKQVKLDNYVDYKPTLIKMDIEGAELDSLKGASEIIRRYKPKLAICLYHLPLDFYEIPMFIKTLVPEYRLKVRQHGRGFCETVLYAYVD